MSSKWEPRQIVHEKHPVHRSEISTWAKKLNETQIAALLQSVTQLDAARLNEEAELLRESILEVMKQRGARHREPDKLLKLLERNLWSTVDCIAADLDNSAFRAAFQDVVRALEGADVGNAALAAVEYELFLDFLRVDGQHLGQLGISRADFEAYLAHAAKENRDLGGFNRILAPDFSFRTVAANACGRPGNPVQAVAGIPGWKWVAAIFLFLVDVLLLWLLGKMPKAPLPFVVIGILSIVASILMLIFGC